MSEKRFLSIMLLAVAFVAWTPLHAAEQADTQAIKQDQRMAQAALEVALLVDHNKEGEVWDGASSIAKKLVTHDAFVSQIAADRQVVGTIVSRSLASVSYRQSNGTAIPKGIYASVAFSTRFANTKQDIRELVSFHLDSDHVWRVSGYTLRSDVKT